jgi:hypothetical protein
MSAPLVKFKTVGWGKGLIEPVECERETAQAVWIGNSRHAKVGRTYFHDTWELAHAYLLTKAERAVSNCHSRLELASDELDFIKGMKPPKESA